MSRNDTINIKTDIMYRWSEREIDDDFNTCVLATDDLWYLSVLAELAGEGIITEEGLVSEYGEATGNTDTGEWEEGEGIDFETDTW